jgi:23S rRNA (uridine2552-2'-O)-methyltransferase
MRSERRDAYHRRAKREGFRSRAAYKLAEIQRAHGLLEAGQRVVDLGCWPGGWLQVAAAEVGPGGLVVGVDLTPLDPPLDSANVFAFEGDFSDPAIQARILEQLGGPADVLLCDAAPKLTGVRATDRAREEAVLEALEAALPGLLRPGGHLLAKLLECPEAQAFQKRTRSQFASARVVKPPATRKGSSEKYWLARGYAGGPSGART